MKGGATGLDETGELADLLMLWWIDEFLAALKKLNLNLDLLTLFKDDLGVITDKISIWMDLDLIEGKLVPKEAQNTVEISEEQHTAKILCQVADNVLEMLSFTFDLPEMNPDGQMPILDLKVKLNQSGLVSVL